MVHGEPVARDRAEAALSGFDFDQVRETTDEALLPGAMKYGGVRGLASVAGTGPTWSAGAPASPVAPWMPLPPSVTMLAPPASSDALVDAALRR